MNDNKFFCTIFTPAYNRAHTLERLYKSLQKQTDFDFEWVVIDDGSKDNTEQLFEKWLSEENKFEIIYKKIENGGKHRAVNKGIDIAKGKMFFIVDSDDFLTEDAVEKIKKWENTLEKSSNKFAGLGFCRGFSKEKINGTSFKGEYLDATSAERKKYNINGDKAEVFYTNVLKKYKFPEIEGEKFVPENVVWLKLSMEGYKLRWINEIIYIGDYLEGGLTQSGMKLYINNPKGYLLSLQTILKAVDMSYFEKLGLYYNYYKNINSKEYTIKEIAKDLYTSEWNIKVAIFLKKIKNKIKGEKNEI